MNTNRASVLAVFLAAGFGVAPSAVALDIKPGLWEFTLTMVTKGALPYDLSQLPPEERAELEREFAAEAGEPETSTDRDCVTQEEIDEVELFETEQESFGEKCVRDVETSSATRWSATEKCRSEAGTRESRIAFEARTPEEFHGTMEIRVASAAGNTSIDISMAGKWLGASCGDLEDEDEYEDQYDSGYEEEE